MKKFSSDWNSSRKPNKQRKYRYNAPLHIRGKFMSAHLSKELQKRHSIRSLRLRLGDKIRIMRGQFKRQEGKVEEVDLKNFKVFISKIEHTKRDGTKARYPIDPSNVMIVELNESKKRFKKSARPKAEKSASKTESMPKMDAQEMEAQGQKAEENLKPETGESSGPKKETAAKKRKTTKTKKV